jgi:Flp pilus assembly pilin Flp
MQKNNGQEAIEFVLIAVLVFFAALGTILMFGGQLKSFFETTSAIATSANSSTQKISITTKSKYTPDYETKTDDTASNPYDIAAPDYGNDSIELMSGGSLNGSIDNPVTQCDNSSCIMDFGNIAITNVPKDFNQYIQTTGASGGTEMMAGILTQIAQQMEINQNSAEASKIKDLANLGHNMAVIQRIVEDKVIACNFDETCVEKVYNEQAVEPQGYDSSVVAFPDLTYGDLIRSIELATNMADNNLSHDSLFTKVKNIDTIGEYYLQTYLELNNNTNLDQNVKNVIYELSNNISVINEDFQNNFNLIFQPDTPQQYCSFDDFNCPKENTPSDVVDNFKSYNASKITHFDSSVMCAAGSHEDTGTSCH